MGLTRDDCIKWFEDEYPGRMLPRSACIACPYRSREGWITLATEDPEAFADAIRTDQALRSPEHNATRMFRKKVYLHPQRIPLEEAVLADLSQNTETGESYWGNECTGICGV